MTHVTREIVTHTLLLSNDRRLTLTVVWASHEVPTATVSVIAHDNVITLLGHVSADGLTINVATSQLGRISRRDWDALGTISDPVPGGQRIRELLTQVRYANANTP